MKRTATIFWNTLLWGAVLSLIYEELVQWGLLKFPALNDVHRLLATLTAMPYMLFITLQAKLKKRRVE